MNNGIENLLVVTYGLAPAAAARLTQDINNLPVADRDGPHVDAILAPFIQNVGQRANATAAVLGLLLAPPVAPSAPAPSISIPLVVPTGLVATVNVGQAGNQPTTSTTQTQPAQQTTTNRSGINPWLVAFFLLLLCGGVALGILGVCGGFTKADKDEIVTSVDATGVALGTKIDELKTAVDTKSAEVKTAVDTGNTQTQQKLGTIGRQVDAVHAHSAASLQILLAATGATVADDGTVSAPRLATSRDVTSGLAGVTSSLAGVDTKLDGIKDAVDDGNSARAEEARKLRAAIRAAAAKQASSTANAIANIPTPQIPPAETVDLSSLPTRRDLDASKREVLDAIQAAKARVVVTP